MSQERAGRYQRSVSGMVGAMLILLLVVVGFVVLRGGIRADPGNPVEPVDVAGPAEFARTEATFPLVAPDPLPAGWIATSVRFERGDDPAWHVGTLTDERRYVGLEQSTDSATRMVERHVDEEAERGAEVEVAGATWVTWTDAEGDLALVREEPEVTTLVVGRVDLATLETFVATLR